MDTASTIGDYSKSDALVNFKKGVLSKVSMMQSMDLKMIGSIAVVAAGVLCGIVLLIR